MDQPEGTSRSPFLGTEIQNVLDNTFAGTFQPVNGGRFGASLSSRQMGLTPWSRRSPKTRGPPRTKAIGGGPKSSVHYGKRLLLFSRSQRHERRARRGRWICDNQHQPKRLVSHVSNRCTRHRGILEPHTQWHSLCFYQPARANVRFMQNYVENRVLTHCD